MSFRSHHNIIAKVFFVALVLCISTPLSFAKESTQQGGELFSIEKRNLMGNHELSISMGTLPMDAFGKGLTIQGGYAYHFSQLIGWEIIGGTYSFILGTGLKDELKNRFQLSPELEGELQAILHSNVIFKPLYGKLAFINDHIITAELYGVLGPSIAFLTDGARPIGFDIGVGLRFFLGAHFSLKIDIRDYLFLPDFKKVANHLYIGLGASLTFGFGESESEDD